MALLDINTLVKRETITIDGVSYELRNVEELSPIETASLSAAANGLQAHVGADVDLQDQAQLEEANLDEDAYRMVVMMLDKMVNMVVIGLPADVFAKLQDGHKIQIVSAFFQASKIETPGMDLDALTQTGASRLPSSNDTTAETQEAG